MKARHKRFGMIAVLLVGFGVASWLVISNFNDNLVFFYTPTQVVTGEIKAAKEFRVGGLVEINSLKRIEGTTSISFGLTDNLNRLSVSYTGILPDLFKEGKGAVVKGRLIGKDEFQASEILAKHDENYMPVEIKQNQSMSPSLIP